MSATKSSSSCRNGNEVQFVEALKIHEGCRFNFNHQLLLKFIIYEHKVHGSSSKLLQKKSSCIEIVAYASPVNTRKSSTEKKKIDDKINIEASRLYLCSEKLFISASLCESASLLLFKSASKGSEANKGHLKRYDGSRNAQNLIIDYISPRINISKINESKDMSLRVEWVPAALDREKNADYDGFKVRVYTFM
jgi:hypothetical protein